LVLVCVGGGGGLSLFQFDGANFQY
jgi:hypothetical protein